MKAARRSSLAQVIFVGIFLIENWGCGGSSSNQTAPPPPPISVSVSPGTATVQTGSTAQLSATVTNDTSNGGVRWAISCAVAPCGSISPVTTMSGAPATYTAPTSIAASVRVTVTATSGADSSKSSSATLIPVGHISGYDAGVDYHSYGADFQHTAFIMNYDQASVRSTVQTQLQGMADRGATVIFTRLWMVTNPGDTNFGESWRTHFPLSTQEAQNLHTYIQDVAAVRGADGNPLRLWICLLWLGASDYTIGSPTTSLGSSNLSAADFTSRVETTVSGVLSAAQGVNRQDGVPVVERIYLDGEVMIGAKANQDWFLTTHYPWFVQQVSAAGFIPTVYFIVADTQADLLDDTFIDSQYPILNYHRSQYWNYRSLKFMADQGLPIPSRIDFSYYISDPTGAPFDTIIARVLDDADAVLPALGAAKSYFFAETSYFQDDTERLNFAQSIVGQAAASPRLTGVCFWTTPDGGGQGVNIAYPFEVENYLPPPN